MKKIDKLLVFAIIFFMTILIGCGGILLGTGKMDVIIKNLKYSQEVKALVGVWTLKNDDNNALYIQENNIITICDWDFHRASLGIWELDLNNKNISMSINKVDGYDLENAIKIKKTYTVNNKRQLIITDDRGKEWVYVKTDKNADAQYTYDLFLILKDMPPGGSNEWEPPVNVETGEAIAPTDEPFVADKQQYTIDGKTALIIIDNYFNGGMIEPGTAVEYDGLCVINNRMYHTIFTYIKGDEMLHGSRYSYVDVDTGTVYDGDYNQSELFGEYDISPDEISRIMDVSPIEPTLICNVNNEKVENFISIYNDYLHGYDQKYPVSITLNIETRYIGEEKYNEYVIWTYDGKQVQKSPFRFLENSDNEIMIYDEENESIVSIKAIEEGIEIIKRVGKEIDEFYFAGQETSSQKEVIMFKEKSEGTIYYIDINEKEIIYK